MHLYYSMVVMIVWILDSKGINSHAYDLLNMHKMRVSFKIIFIDFLQVMKIKQNTNYATDGIRLMLCFSATFIRIGIIMDAPGISTKGTTIPTIFRVSAI